MSTPAQDIQQILEDAEIGNLSDDSWPIYVSNTPAEVNDVITVYDRPGSIVVPTSVNAQEHNFMVRVRSSSYSSGYAKALACYNHLHGFGGHSNVINDRRYQTISAIAGINAVGRDENERSIFTINMRAITQDTN